MGVSGIFDKSGEMPGDAVRLSEAGRGTASAEEQGWCWATDSDGKLTYLSQIAIANFTDNAGVLGFEWSDLVETAEILDDPLAEQSLSAVLAAQCSFRDRPVVLRAERLRRDTADEEIWWALTGHPHFGEENNFLGYRGSARDITKGMHAKLQRMSASQGTSFVRTTSRHRLIGRLDRVLSARRAEQRTCAILLIGLDRFKQIAQSLGDPAAGELLQQASQRLKGIAPDRVDISRIGDEQFQLIVADEDDRGKLGNLANCVIQTLAKPYVIDDKVVSIGVSVGMAIAPFDGAQAAALMNAGELALYAAKAARPGQFRFYSNDLKTAAERQRKIEADMRDAVSNGQLEIHYQPIVDRITHEAVGFEALMRWNHPEHGLIGPRVFTPREDDGHLVEELGEWAVCQACRDASIWPQPLRVSINIANRQFANDRVLQIIDKALQSSGLHPARLQVQISETAFAGDPVTTQKRVRQIRALGVRVAIDGFGTAPSSLANLHRAVFDTVKIDRDLVHACASQGQGNQPVIAAIIDAARDLKIETIAEGVEAMDALDNMTRLNVDGLQGFIFSRAISQRDVLAKLRSENRRYAPAGPATQRSHRRARFLRVGVIYEGHRYTATLRDLSHNSARLQGLLNVPVGTQLILDFGEGQLAPGTVSSSQDATQGIALDTPLVSDGAGGLCTRKRLSPYALAGQGMPLQRLPAGNAESDAAHSFSAAKPRFMQVDTLSGSLRAG